MRTYLRLCLVSIPTYEFDLNYGNDGCDGFTPNFPLIRAKRNQTAKFIQLRHNSSLCIDIIAQISKNVNGFCDFRNKTIGKRQNVQCSAKNGYVCMISFFLLISQFTKRFVFYTNQQSALYHRLHCIFDNILIYPEAKNNTLRQYAPFRFLRYSVRR